MLADTAVASKLGNLIIRTYVLLGASEPIAEAGTDRFAAWNAASTDTTAGVIASDISMVQ